MNRIKTLIHHSLEDIYSPGEIKALSMIICCDILGIDAVDLYLDKDITLSDSKQRELENIIIRLQNNEPIQYVKGYTEFLGNNFKVAPGVLIPRPETAELVQLIIKEVKGHPVKILDIGTGSGCIAISLNKKLPNSDVEAWDVSKEALDIACLNNEMLNAQVTFRQQNVFDDLNECNELYDVIVSNPPYVAESEKEKMEANVLYWEPELALFVPDQDPLLFYRRIAEIGRKLLRPDGRIFFEINQAHKQDMIQLMEENRYRNVHVIKDIFDNNRILTANR